MVTLKQIAQRTGLSVTAVSYALRDHPRIPESTRSRVKAAARELGYAPDVRLGQLMTHLQKKRGVCGGPSLAWLNSSAHPQHWHVTPWAREFFASASARAGELGFTLDEIWVHDPKLPATRLNDVLQSRGIQGLMLSTPLRGEEWTNWIDWPRYAAVVLDDPESLPRLDRVYARYASNLRVALQQLQKRGYRRPKLWLGAHDDYWTARGYTHEALRHQHLHPDAPAVLTPSCDDTSDEAILRWLDTHQPDVVIGPTATLGTRLRGLGQRIPADLGYLAMYVLETDTEWSGLSQQHSAQATLAVDHLAHLLRTHTLGPRQHPVHLQIDGEWHEGLTLRPPDPVLAVDEC
ncbi:MAG: LacI family DNA-binding transcriptional regulator [Opitutaceae bacterium]|nr:LacI family DNA-binding transcriptional regulator [Opitutaceae bacterium]